ncbi:MAG TPA: YidC/Oxa1 family membrane protein insertase [Aggregatilineales bacterium]|nr:membrane protein insertase YidC [Anaerolineales bacterium]HRE47983.1 YidC/Oxa1 family membrane protein insertase [Aggregatilineales bacterium]
MDFLTNPFIIILLWLYNFLGGSLILAIVVFTVMTRVVTFPLIAQQMKSTKKMQELAPALKEIREKFKGDREKQAQAQMELYKTYGVNPLAGCFPLLIQMPILFGLYGAIYASLGHTPLQLLDLSHRLQMPSLSEMIPLHTQFLWMDLGQPDGLFVLPILVVATTWLQMKLTMPPVADPKDPSAAMTRNMTTIMPLMIGLFSLQFASGLSIYWVVGNTLGIIQYALMGRIDFRNFRGKVTTPAKTVSLKDIDLKAIEAMPSKRKITAPAPAGANSGGGRNTPAPLAAPTAKRKLNETKAGQARKNKK